MALCIQCDRLSGELISQAKYSSMHLAGEIMLPDDVAQRLLVLLGSRVENICTLELPGLREGSPLLGAGGPRISLFRVPFFP